MEKIVLAEHMPDGEWDCKVVSQGEGCRRSGIAGRKDVETHIEIDHGITVYHFADYTLHVMSGPKEAT